MPRTNDFPNLTLANIAQGAAHELFDAEMARVLENILDPNTRAEAKRTIKLTFVIEPDENRRECRVGVDATAKLAASKPAGGVIYVGRVDGKPAATSMMTRQDALPFDAPVTPLAATPPAGPTLSAVGG